MSKDGFMNDRKTQQAVLMNFMTIGEAAVLLKNEHSAFIAEHAEIPWNKMRGMRNILTHEYWNINPASIPPVDRGEFLNAQST